MLTIFVQCLTIIFLLYVFFKVEDEREANKNFINWLKSVTIILAAASVLKFGKSIFVLLAVVLIGIVALAKRHKKLKNV